MFHSSHHVSQILPVVCELLDTWQPMTVTLTVTSIRIRQSKNIAHRGLLLISVVLSICPYALPSLQVIHHSCRYEAKGRVVYTPCSIICPYCLCPGYDLITTAHDTLHCSCGLKQSITQILCDSILSQWFEAGFLFVSGYMNGERKCFEIALALKVRTVQICYKPMQPLYA